MIALTRIRTAKAIPAVFRGADKREMEKELLLGRLAFLNNPDEKQSFKSSYWKKAKKQLKKESKGKCAYCEANTDVVAHGDVEHYRPKSIYWWLAYTYDNYLYACQICNQIYKNDHFPVGATIFPGPTVLQHMTAAQAEAIAGTISPDPIDTSLNYTLHQFTAFHTAELAYLINPYFDDPAAFFAYEADDVIEEVKVVPAKKKYAPYVQAAEDYYGINRIELKNIRYSVYTKFRAFKLAYADLTDTAIKKEVKKQIDDMLSDKYVFAGMNRYFDQHI